MKIEINDSIFGRSKQILLGDYVVGYIYDKKAVIYHDPYHRLNRPVRARLETDKDTVLHFTYEEEVRKYIKGTEFATFYGLTR